MVRQLEYRKQADLSGLHKELVAAGIAVSGVWGSEASTTFWVAVEEAVSEAAVAAVVAAHDQAGWAAGREALLTNERLIRERLLAGLTAADTHLANLAGTPTVAQQKAALVFAIKGVKQLARLELRALESAD